MEGMPVGDEKTRSDAGGKRRSDFERYSEEQRRYAALRREARLLRQEAAGAPLHPWLKASQEAKAKRAWNESGRIAVRRTPRLAFAAAVFLLCLAALAAGAAVKSHRSGAPEAAGQARRALHVWHDVKGPEQQSRLACLAAEYASAAGGVEVIVTHQPDIAEALADAFFTRAVPHVVVLGQNDAERFASLGLLAPVLSGGASGYFLPLAEAGPWSLPLVAALPARPAGAAPDEASHRLLRHLVEHLRHHPDQQGAEPAP